MAINGGNSVFRDRIPTLEAGPRSPTLGHDAEGPGHYNPFDPPPVEKPTLQHSFHMENQHTGNRVDFPKSTTAKVAENVGRSFKSPVHEKVTAVGAKDEMIEDSPTGKKFTEHLHERRLNGRFIPSSGKSKPHHHRDKYNQK